MEFGSASGGLGSGSGVASGGSPARPARLPQRSRVRELGAWLPG